MFKVLILFVMIALTGIFYLIFSSDISTEDKRFNQKILDNINKPTRFISINSDDWDYVCYVDSYSNISESVAKDLPKIIYPLRFLPGNRYVDEERFGIVFVNAGASSARVFLIDNQIIGRINGPKCIERSSDTFLLSQIIALNKTYLNLAIGPR